MVRWLFAFAVAALAACRPETELPLCAPIHEACPVVIEIDASWREIPDQLAPDETVVEIEFVAAAESAVHYTSSETYETLLGEAERACTEVVRKSISRYRITRAVRGAFDQPAFLAIHSPQGCGSDGPPLVDATASGRSHARIRGHAGPLYFVIRPARPDQGLVSEGQAMLRDGPPLMSFRDCCGPPDVPNLNASPN